MSRAQASILFICLSCGFAPFLYILGMSEVRSSIMANYVNMKHYMTICGKKPNKVQEQEDISPSNIEHSAASLPPEVPAPPENTSQTYEVNLPPHSIAIIACPPTRSNDSIESPHTIHSIQPFPTIKAEDSNDASHSMDSIDSLHGSIHIMESV